MNDKISLKEKMKLHFSFILSIFLGFIIIAIGNYFIFDNLISNFISNYKLIIFIIFPLKFIFITYIIYYVINILPLDLFSSKLDKEIIVKLKNKYLYFIIFLLVVIAHF